MIKYEIYKIEEKSNKDQTQICRIPIDNISISEKQFNLIHDCVKRYLGTYTGVLPKNESLIVENLLRQLKNLRIE